MRRVTITDIPIEELYVSGLNVRKELVSLGEDSDINTLANDISRNGLINPISVRKVGDRYEIYAGQRRFIAINTINWTHIPCIVSDVDDVSAEIISLAENIQRTKLSSRDKCRVYSKYFELNGRDINTLSKITSVSTRTLRRYINLEATLSPELLDRLDAVDDDHITIELAASVAKNVPIAEQAMILTKIQRVTNPSSRRTILSNYRENTSNPGYSIDRDIDMRNVSNLETMTVSAPLPPYVYDSDGGTIMIPEDLYMPIIELINEYNSH